MDETTLQLINMICRRAQRVNQSARCKTIAFPDVSLARALPERELGSPG